MNDEEGVREWKIGPQSEYRFEVDAKRPIAIKVCFRSSTSHLPKAWFLILVLTHRTRPGDSRQCRGFWFGNGSRTHVPLLRRMQGCHPQLGGLYNPDECPPSNFPLSSSQPNAPRSPPHVTGKPSTE